MGAPTKADLNTEVTYVTLDLGVLGEQEVLCHFRRIPAEREVLHPVDRATPGSNGGVALIGMHAVIHDQPLRISLDRLRPWVVDDVCEQIVLKEEIADEY